MPRRLIGWLLVWLALAVPALAQSNGSLLGLNVGAPPSSGYTGPIDIVASPNVWYGLRAVSAAYAASTGLAINVRRASDNVACDVDVAASGALGVTTAACNSSTQGGITPAAFAGTDATATCTLATTTATCSGASSTPHVGGSTVAGAGVTQPCLITAVGTFTGGAGTFTTSLAGTSTSCGTIGSGETFTMTYGLFTTEAYDQSGANKCNSSTVPCNLVQSTAADQPHLLPNCGNALPCLLGVNGNSTGLYLSAQNAVTQAQPLTISAVALYLVQADTRIFSLRAGSPAPFLAISATSGDAYLYAGSAGQNFTMSIGVLHAVQALFNGSSSIAYVDGSSTSLSPGASSTQTTIAWMTENLGGVAELTGYVTEAGYWPIGFTPTQAANMRTNQKTYWSTP